MTHKAVVMVDGKSGERSLFLLGLPLLERAILEAARAGIRDFALVLPPGAENSSGLTRSMAERGLRLQTVRAVGKTHPLVAAGDLLGEDFLVLGPNLLFDAELARSLARADDSRQDALVAISAAEGEESQERFLSGVAVPLWRLTASGLARLRSAPPYLSLAATLEFLQRHGLVEPYVYPADKALCVPLRNRADARASEEKLFRIVGEKPTDGIFARFNKRVLARPLIRLFVALNLSPNLITLGGIALAILSGLVFAAGGRWPSLAGAALFFLSSLLDHCDGVVARLRYRDSNFGAWLDSVADQLSYLAVFAGMSHGLYRETGQERFLYLGALLLGGGVLSLLADSYQRRKIGGAQPHTYYARWQKLAEERISHPAVFIARKFHFVVRRATVPYWILGFTLFERRALFLLITALGANLVWIFILGTYRLMRAGGARPLRLDQAPEAFRA